MKHADNNVRTASSSVARTNDRWRWMPVSDAKKPSVSVIERSFDECAMGKESRRNYYEVSSSCLRAPRAASSRREYIFQWKKRSEETQTLRTGCSKATFHPYGLSSIDSLAKIFAPPLTPSRGAGRPKFNQLEMVTTFTHKPSSLRIDSRNFEL